MYRHPCYAFTFRIPRLITRFGREGPSYENFSGTRSQKSLRIGMTQKPSQEFAEKNSIEVDCVVRWQKGDATKTYASKHNPTELNIKADHRFTAALLPQIAFLHCAHILRICLSIALKSSQTCRRPLPASTRIFPSEAYIWLQNSTVEQPGAFHLSR